MKRSPRHLISALIATAVTAALICAGFIASGRLDWLDIVLAATSIIYLAVAFVGAAIVRAQPANRTGWLFLLSGVASPVGNAIQNASHVAYHDGHPRAAVWLDLSSNPFAVLAIVTVATFGILLFPDRSLDTRRRRVLAWIYAADTLVLMLWTTFGSQSPTIAALDNPIGTPAADSGVLGILIFGPLSLTACISLWRFARRDTGPYAPALRTAASVALLVPASYIACVVVGFSGGNTDQIGAVENCAALALGLAAWAGIVRYGLFNTRAVLNRTLVYAVLSITLIAIYLAIVLVLGQLFDGRLPQVAAAVAAALAALPLRTRAQRRINQLIYGLRDDPAAAFARLGDRLDAAGAPEEILPAAARTVAEALRLPYVAVEVGGDILCRHGRELPHRTQALPLPFAGETIGHLLLQTRDNAELGTDERRLLADLTRQVAVAARAVALTHALQLSRQHLVTLREEERRRLRRDLHDGLGPTLAGIALGIDTVRRAVPADSSTVDLLAVLRRETEDAVADIRRIVYDLRPPILDELGLAGAVREQAVRLGASSVDVPDEMPPLPAAVEVAAYRIAVEALTNAARHAPGAPVTVHLAVGHQLDLSISDGGDGLPDGYRAGVGLNSMRERAAELGGSCVISRRDPAGTLVRARFPLPHALSALDSPDAFAPDSSAPDSSAPDSSAPDLSASDPFAPGSFAPGSFAPGSLTPGSLTVAEPV